MDGAGLLYARLERMLAASARLSAPRRMVLAVVAAEPAQDWTVESLQAACNLRQAGAISRASSYRTLGLLQQLGLLEAAGAPTEVQRWRLAARCLAEIELADQTDIALQRHLPADKWLRRYVQQLAARHGLELDGFELRLQGRFVRPTRRAARSARPSKL